MASPQEGETIVQAAWQLRRGLFPKPDCSHFVHAVYTQAGFLYQYAASRAVFAGIAGFRRVVKPQSGDVIVWQGHIGIVIDPREHSFYSSVTAGFAIQSYESRYWRGRGIPRFYRFVVNDLQSPPPLLANLALANDLGPALSSLALSLPARPPILMQAETGPMLAQSDSRENSTPESAQVPVRQTQEQRPIMEERPIEIHAIEAAANDTEVSDRVLVTSRATPAKKEVLAAVRRSVDARGERLLHAGSLDSQPSVGVVDRVRIVAINLQGDSGFAEVEVKQKGGFQYGKAIPTRTKVIQHAILSRQEQGWVLEMPQDLMCLNRTLAVTALTDRLDTAPTPELRDSRRLLHELESERSLWHPRTWFRLSRSSAKSRSAREMES
jgi:hypothetical protein